MRKDSESDAELDHEDRALVAKLRELPPEGTEPDWQALEAAIHAEVGDEAPRPWWRNWRWIVPVWALATTAAVALLLSRAHHDVPTPTPTPQPIARPAAVTPPPPATQESAPAVWLDGEPVEIDDVEIEIPDV